MEQIAHFTLTIPKHAKALAKFVGTDPYREAMQYVCIEPQRGFLTATNTHMLQVINAECTGEWPEASKNQFGALVVNFCILVDPKHIAKMAGKAVNVAVYTEQREVVEVRTVSLGIGSATRKEKVNRTCQITQIECDGVTYTTVAKKMHFPDVMRVIPRSEGCRAIRLTAESMEALKTFCKLNKGKDYIALDVAERNNIAIVCATDAYDQARTAVMLELAKDAELTDTVGLNPAYLLTCMDGSNGVIMFDAACPACRPVMFEGNAAATILMPASIEYSTLEYARQLRAERVLSSFNFAESAAEVVKQLQMAANNVWDYLKECNTHNGKCSLNPGNYTAADVANFKHGVVWKSDSEPIVIEYGRISMHVNNSRIFATLAAWESATRSPKKIFSVGNVEEVTATVLQRNGDEVEEKKMKLRVLGGGWYSTMKRNKRDWDAPVYCEANGSIIFVRNLPINTIDDAEAFATFAEGKAEQIPGMIKAAAKDVKYFAALAERLGLEATTSEEAAKIAEERDAERIKEQAATASEVAEIPTAESEVEKVSAKGESEEIKHISEIIKSGNFKLDDNSYYTWLMLAQDEPRLTITERALNDALNNIIFAEYKGSGRTATIHYHGGLVDTVFFPPLPHTPPESRSELPNN